MKSYISKTLLLLTAIVCFMYFSQQAHATQKIAAGEPSPREQIARIKKDILEAQKRDDILEEASLLVQIGHLLLMDARYVDALEAENTAIEFISKNIEKQEKLFGSKEKVVKLTKTLTEALSNKGLAQVYCEQANLALETFRSILSTLNSSNINDSISIALAKTYNGMGIVFAHRMHFNVALPYLKKSLYIYTKLNDDRGMYIVNSNIGSCLLSQNKYREALIFLSKAQSIVLKENYQKDEMIYTNLSLAVAYQGLGDNRIAERFFVDAIESAEKKKLKHLLILLRYNYARNLSLQTRYTEAEKMALQCYKEVQDKPISTIVTDLLSILGSIKTAQGDYLAANKYLRLYISKADSLNQQAKQEDLLHQKFEFDNYKQEQQRQNEIKNLELAKTKITNRNLWILVLCLCIIGSIIAFTYLSRKYNIQHSSNEEIAKKLREQNETDKKRLGSLEEHFDAQLEGKNKKLASNALLFLRLGSIGSDIVEKTKQLKVNFALRGKEKMLTSEIEHLAEQLEQNKGWGEFEFYFEQVDKEFLLKLSEQYPSLTPKEKQLCVLFNLNLSNKEIASLTGKTLQSVGMAKFRLKKKMDLDEESDISNILQKL